MSIKLSSSLRGRPKMTSLIICRFLGFDPPPPSPNRHHFQISLTLPPFALWDFLRRLRRQPSPSTVIIPSSFFKKIRPSPPFSDVIFGRPLKEDSKCPKDEYFSPKKVPVAVEERLKNTFRQRERVRAV